LSLVKFSFQALCVNEFQGLVIPCSPRDAGDCVRTGEQVLARSASPHPRAACCPIVAGRGQRELDVAQVVLEVAGQGAAGDGVRGRRLSFDGLHTQLVVAGARVASLAPRVLLQSSH
jgi:hypothetical protein